MKNVPNILSVFRMFAAIAVITLMLLIDPKENRLLFILLPGIIFGIGVFAVMAIKNDAYLKLHEKRSTQLTVLILVTVVNAVSGIVNFINDAKSGSFLMNALCAVLGIVILAAILLHQKNEAGNAEGVE